VDRLDAENELSDRLTRGSRARCVALTSTSDGLIQRLGKLVRPFAAFDLDDLVYFPKGPQFPDEAKLGETACLLDPDRRKTVTAWWLAVRRGANTPNWDIAAKCLILGKPGLILVEAKAHDKEFDLGGFSATNPENKERIRQAMHEANCWLNARWPKWNLNIESHYQLSNRFAWVWKVASLGVPVILVWLGFLNAEEMRDRGTPFRSSDEWHYAVLKYAKGVVPEDVWGRVLEVSGTPFLTLIRACEQSLPFDA
jgi:hypothetical protein